MRASQIVERVRYALHDNIQPYRWTDQVLLNFINDGIRDIRSLRPETQIDENELLIPYVELTLVGGNLPTNELILSDSWLNTLVNYVCYRALELDTEVKLNAQRAAEFFKLYLQGVTNNG